MNLSISTSRSSVTTRGPDIGSPASGRAARNAGGSWEFVDVAIDDHSRVAFARVMASEKIEAQSVIRCDLPYYDTTITRDFVARMNCFARDLGILNTDVPFERIVACRTETASPDPPPFRRICSIATDCPTADCRASFSR